MFQFTTTTIINGVNAVDVEGKPLLNSAGAPVARFSGDAKAFQVIGTGTFKKDGIASVYKRAYTAGVKEVATITLPATTAGKLLRLTVDVKLSGKTQSDYTNFYMESRQPLTVDIISTGTAAGDATEFARVLNGIKTEFGRSLFTAKANGTALELNARDDHQRFKLVKLEEVGDVPFTTINIPITQVALGTIKTKGVVGFGDDSWMLRTTILPTYENTRHFGTLRDERPVLGANYSQFTMKYMVKSGDDCVWDGDKKSVTTHVFWVAASQVAAFEAALKATFNDVETVVDTQVPTYESEPGGAVGSDDPASVTP